MKNLFLSVVLLLTVSFTFAANDVETVSTFDVEKTVELTNSVELSGADFTAENYSITKVVDNALGCLLKFTFILEDGSQVVRYYYTSQSCAEFFAQFE